MNQASDQSLPDKRRCKPAARSQQSQVTDSRGRTSEALCVLLLEPSLKSNSEFHKQNRKPSLGRTVASPAPALPNHPSTAGALPSNQICWRSCIWTCLCLLEKLLHGPTPDHPTPFLGSSASCSNLPSAKRAPAILPAPHCLRSLLGLFLQMV